MESHREARLEAIARILSQQSISSQATLVELLDQEGYSVTQSSVSRDLRFLGAIRMAKGYALPSQGNLAEQSEHDREILKSLVQGAQAAGPYLLVLRTSIGGASRVGLVLDRSSLPGVVGTVAGDDTVFVAMSSKKELLQFEETLRQLSAH